jgi:DNA primase
MSKRILKEAATFYHNNLMNLDEHDAAWRYLKSRGIRRKTAIRFMLGSTQWLEKYALWDYLNSKGYPDSMIIRARLYQAIESETIQTFAGGRIIFPVFDEYKNVRNMTSRTLPGVISFAPHKHMPKIKYSIYDSISCEKAYGDNLFVVEGPFDRLTLEQAGLNSVCFFGTQGFKPEYAQSLAYAETIYVLPDADGKVISRNANFKSYIKMEDACSPQVPRINVIDLPNDSAEKVDPNSFFGKMNDNEVRKVMQDLVDKSVPLHKTPEYKAIREESRNSQEKKQIKLDKARDVDDLLSFPIKSVFEMLGIELREEAGLFKCRCIDPKHEDKKASMAIYPETNTWHCFSCKVSGDNIGAVSVVKGTSFIESCKILKGEL